MVGRAVCELSRAAGDLTVPYNHKDLDISDYDQVSSMLHKVKPEVVINCAAWTDVDGCEFDSHRALAVHSFGPENLARVSRELDATLITISTDYVFDGYKEGFYTQRDQPNPESIYGQSKLEGERRAQAAWARTIVVRTGFIFGTAGKNFLSTIIDRARRGETMRAIGDAWGTPTYAPDLASRLRELAVLNVPGTFHVTNTGDGATYEQFTSCTLKMAGFEGVKVDVILSDQLDRPAKRPRNSRLKCLISEHFGLSPLPFWKDSLGRFVRDTFVKESAEN
jgi:dTDP-4-dehydrorhamnose reductase